MQGFAQRLGRLGHSPLAPAQPAGGRLLLLAQHQQQQPLSTTAAAHPQLRCSNSSARPGALQTAVAGSQATSGSRPGALQQRSAAVAGSQLTASSSSTKQPLQQQQQQQQQQPVGQPLPSTPLPQQPPPIPREIKSVLFSEAEVRAKVAELGSRIVADYADKQLAIIGVLNGAFIFTSDLVREVSAGMPSVKVDFLRASSYGSAAESSGDVTVEAAPGLSKWADYHILLVEDIIDSGHTLARLSRFLERAGAASVKVVALLDKKGRRRVECFPDYVGWECPNEFVVGYGLDFNEMYRCLPYVAALAPEVYGGSSDDGDDDAGASNTRAA